MPIRLRHMAIPFGLAGMGVGMGMLGEQMASAGMAGTAGLTSGGAAAVGFVGPAVNIVGAGMVLGLLREGFKGHSI